MEADHELIVATLLAGGNVEEAAQRIGRPTATVRRWLTQGRKHPGGPWGDLARRADAARTVRSSLPEDSGPRLAEVEMFIATLGDTEPEMVPRIGLLRAMARKLDWAEATSTGIAAMAAERIAARYADLLDTIQPATSNDIEKLREALFSGQHEDAFRRVLERIADGTLTGDDAAEAARKELDAAAAADARDKGGLFQ